MKPFGPGLLFAGCVLYFSATFWKVIKMSSDTHDVYFRTLQKFSVCAARAPHTYWEIPQVLEPMTLLFHPVSSQLLSLPLCSTSSPQAFHNSRWAQSGRINIEIHKQNLDLLICHYFPIRPAGTWGPGHEAGLKANTTYIWSMPAAALTHRRMTLGKKAEAESWALSENLLQVLAPAFCLYDHGQAMASSLGEVIYL